MTSGKILRETYGYLKTEDTEHLKENYEPGGYLVIRTMLLSNKKIEHEVVALL